MSTKFYLILFFFLFILLLLSLKLREASIRVSWVKKKSKQTFKSSSKLKLRFSLIYKIIISNVHLSERTQCITSSQKSDDFLTYSKSTRQRVGTL